MKHTFDENYWEKHYRNFKTKPNYSEANRLIVDETTALPPGDALDAGCGAGSDALWLARQGWRVTAVDISESALKVARASAEVEKLSVNFEKVDLTTWSPIMHYYDLVSSSYVHTTDDRSYIGKISRAVKPGGILMIIGHQPPESGEKDSFAHGSHITAQEIASFLDGDEWDIEIAESRQTSGTPSKSHQFLNSSVFKAQRKLF